MANKSLNILLLSYRPNKEKVTGRYRKLYNVKHHNLHSEIRGTLPEKKGQANQVLDCAH